MLHILSKKNTYAAYCLIPKYISFALQKNFEFIFRSSLNDKLLKLNGRPLVSRHCMDARYIRQSKFHNPDNHRSKCTSQKDLVQPLLNASTEGAFMAAPSMKFHRSYSNCWKIPIKHSITVTPRPINGQFKHRDWIKHTEAY